MKKNNWKKAKLSEIADVRDGTHDSPKMKNEGKYLITSRHIKNGKIDITNANKISIEDFIEVNKRSKVDKWDILFSMIGTVGETALIDFEPDFAIKNVGLFKAQEKDNAKWIYYYLKSQEAKKYIHSQQRGTTQSYITLGDLRKFPINLPPLPTQRRIAAILSALDDKIEINRKISDTLEQIAQAVFKRWFVDFDFPDDRGRPYKSSGSRMVGSELGMIPEGWEVQPIKQLIDYYIGGDWGKDTPNEENDSKYFCIRGADFPGIFDGNPSNIPVRYTKERNLEKRKLRDGDIVLEISGGTKGRPVGRTIYINKYIIKSFSLPFSNSNFCRLIRTTEIYSKYIFGYLTYIYSTGQIEQYQVQSTGIANFQFQDFLEKENILVPSKDVLEKYNLIISSLYDKKYSNQNAVLQQTRDTLLPKLMSGEVEV